MLSRLIIISLLLTGCSDAPDKPMNVSDELMPFVAEAFQTIKKSGGNLKDDDINIILVDHWDSPYMIGTIATARGGMFKEGIVHIEVSKTMWAQLTYVQKRWVIIHEILHDMYNLKHGAVLFMHPAVDGSETGTKYKRAVKDLATFFSYYPNGFKPNN
jgi:hypothetical protein